MSFEVAKLWKEVRIKDIACLERGKFSHRPRNDPKMYGGAHPFIQTGQVAQAGKYILHHKQTLSDLGLSVSKKFRKGTLLMAIAANIGDVGILGFDSYAPDSIVAFITRKGFCTDFLYYHFAAKKHDLNRVKITNTQDNLNLERLNLQPREFPPLHKQSEIAGYLDRKTEQIDRKVELLERKAVLYRELKQSLINETVTCGLDKSASMRDSGVNWVKNIPEHWMVERVKDLFVETSKKGFPNEPLLIASQDRGVISKDLYKRNTMSVQKNFKSLKLVEIGNFVISLRSFEGGIEVAYSRGIISSAYTIMELDKCHCVEYFKHLFKSRGLISILATCTTGIREGRNVNYQEFKRVKLPLPPLEEQQAIANYLDEKTAKIDQIVETIGDQITKLQELRKTLINDAVTGKVRVTEAKEKTS